MPVLIDEAGGLIAGHARVLAARELGISEVPVIVARGWTDAQKRAYLLADNKLAMNAGWDDVLLAAELADLKAADLDLELIGFSTPELKFQLEPKPGVNDPGADDPADAEVEPRAAVTRRGDLWLLGEHRLLCGDSTDAAAVARLMGEDRAALLFTSPPYGNQRNYTTCGTGEWQPYWQAWIEWTRTDGWRRFG